VNYTRRWRIDSAEKLRGVLDALRVFSVDFQIHPMTLELRTEREEKSDAQRKLWHAVIGDLAVAMHMTPAACKLRIKAGFWGVEVKGEGDFYYALVPSSEEAEREEYSRLIDYTYQYAAENGIIIQDRRPK
jgi:hypothetical protein